MKKNEISPPETQETCQNVTVEYFLLIVGQIDNSGALQVSLLLRMRRLCVRAAIPISGVQWRVLWDEFWIHSTHPLSSVLQLVPVFETVTVHSFLKWFSLVRHFFLVFHLEYFGRGVRFLVGWKKNGRRWPMSQQEVGTRKYWHLRRGLPM